MSPPASEHPPALPLRWRSAIPFLAVGSSAIVLGGLVAAVSRPTGFDRGPWLAAFLVLVAGAAQIALGVGQAWLAADRPGGSIVLAETMAWNVGVVATVLGTLATAPILTTVGAAATVVGLGLFLSRVCPPSPAPRWARTVYLAVVTVLLLSTPIGLVLAWSGPR